MPIMVETDEFLAPVYGEFIHPHKFGDGLKFLEFGMSTPGTMFGLAMLLAEKSSMGDGGGDFRYGLSKVLECGEISLQHVGGMERSKIIGRWANCSEINMVNKRSIVIAGDYGKPDVMNVKTSGIDESIQNRNLQKYAFDHFKDISDIVLKEMLKCNFLLDDYMHGRMFLEYAPMKSVGTITNALHDVGKPLVVYDFHECNWIIPTVLFGIYHSDGKLAKRGYWLEHGEVNRQKSPNAPINFDEVTRTYSFLDQHSKKAAELVCCLVNRMIIRRARRTKECPFGYTVKISIDKSKETLKYTFRLNGSSIKEVK